MTSEHISADVLIIGAGAAGIRAALEARREGADTLLVCSGKFGRCGSTFHPSSPTRGIQAATGEPDDTPEHHAREIIDVGLGEADPNLTDVLAREAPRRLNELVEMGVPFAPHRVPGCFSTTPRAAVINNLKGFAIACRSRLDQMGARILEHTTIVKIVMQDHCVIGAIGVADDGSIQTISAGAVIIAAGGGAGSFLRTLAPIGQTGSATVLAHEAGATIKNLEFFQMMLGTLHPNAGDFLDNQLFHKPVTLTDAGGENLLIEVPGDAPLYRTRHMPFSTRDDSKWIDIAIARAMPRGPVTLSAGEKTFHVAPFAHAFNGGIVINERCETGVEGLYACGEAATGMHGADRIGGNMFSATLVFGARAGLYAARHASRTPRNAVRVDQEPLINQPGPLTSSDLHAIQKTVRATLTECAMVIRTPHGLRKGLETIARLHSDLASSGPDHPRARKLFLTTFHLARFAGLLIRAEQSRHESKGPHYLEADPA